MTEREVIQIAIEYALLHGLMLDSPRRGTVAFRMMCFWKPSKVLPEQLVKSSFSYDPKRLAEAGYESEFRANCQAALLSLETCEAVAANAD